MNRLATLAVMTLATLSLYGCAALGPDTLVNAARAKANALPLALAAQDCVVGTPAEAEFAPHFNAILDRVDELEALPLDKTLITAVAAAPAKVASVEADWSGMRDAITSNGVECSEFVKKEAANIEATFAQIKAAVALNETIVYYGEYALTVARLFGVLPGERVKVERMDVPA